MLTKSLEKHHDDQGVQNIKLEMLHSLKRRFCDVETNEALILGTILDPRFKDKFFTSVSARQRGKELLGQKVASLTTVTGSGTEDSSQTERSPPKQPRTEFMESFSEIFEEAGVDCSGNESEVGRYLSEPLIDFHIHDIEPYYLC